ncbi:MAG: permease-like cell division protein FtsX [Proteobacteria bacterium]|nr:permease-like cell division protein FtsX [Pseudomonadota bacterium]
MIHRLASALRRTLRIAGQGMDGSRRATLWTLLVLVCAATAAAIGGVAARSIEIAAAATPPPAGASMVVYLTETASDDTARGLVTQLTGMAGVERAELVSSAETSKRLTRELGESLHDDLAANGLPVSIEVTLAPGVHDVIALSPALQALRTSAGVEDVVVAEADAAPGSPLRSLRVIAWFAAALFGGLALVIILATVRVRLERGRQERQVAELLGAHPGFFAIPTALAGALGAALAGGIAAALVYAGITTWGDAIAPVLGNVELAMPAPAEIAMFVGALGLLGLVGGALAGVAGSAHAPRGIARA